MGTILTPTSPATWADVNCPNPGEPVRIGGGPGVAVIFTGADANGGVKYTSVTSGVRVRHLGGVNKVLDATLSGLDITIQLGTDGAGTVTSTAAQVVAEIAATAAVDAVLDAVATGTGNGLAGIWEEYTAIAGSLVGSARPALQALLDRDQWLKERVAPWGPPARFYSLGGDNKFKVGALQGLEVLAQGSDLEVTVAGLGNNEWRYVYAYASGGAVAFEAVTTVPTADLLNKAGDTTRRYVGCFRTDGSANIRPFMAVRGKYRLTTGAYTTPDIASFGLTHTGWTDLTGTLAPSHVRMMSVVLRYDAGSTNECRVRAKGSAGNGAQLCGGAFHTIDLACSASQVLEVKEDQDTGGTSTIAGYALGWDE